MGDVVDDGFWSEVLERLAGEGLGSRSGVLEELAQEHRAAAVRVRGLRSELLASWPPDVEPVDGPRAPTTVHRLLRRGEAAGTLEIDGGSPIDVAAASPFFHLLGAEIESERLRVEARERANRDRVLGEIGSSLTSVLDRERVLERLACRLRGAVDHQLFSVLLWDEEASVLRSIFSRTWDGTTGHRWTAAPGEGICGIVARDRRAVRVGDVRLDSRYLACGDEKTRSELAVPLLVQDRLIGVLDLEAHRVDAFAEADEQLLAHLASSVAIALENSRLHALVRDRERRLARDLDAARKVHEALLPRQTPWVPGLQVAVSYRAARELGGDLYDILQWGEERAAFAVGDVAGKGAASALYGALALGALRAHAGGGGCDPLAVVEHLDSELRQLTVARRFLAFAFADFDCSTGVLRIVNAGLPEPLLVRDGVPRALDLHGLPLGTLARARRRQVEMRLVPGDLLLVTSDGIDEARDPAGRTFGGEPLAEAVRGLVELPAFDIAEGVVAAADDWAEAITDDRTVLVARVTDACRCR